MPTRPLRPCTKAGCPKLVEHGRCDDHQQELEAQRGTAAERGYDADWQGVRADYAHEHPLCEDCEAKGKIVPVAIVDHVIPLRAGGARLDKRNLRSQCRPCHKVKTDQDLARWPTPVRPTPSAGWVLA